jgi:N-succinyldiaminopimelate aminotransferase
VWEEVLTGDAAHISPYAQAPERTIKIGSAGKLLALTGWKVGWVVAEAALAERVAQVHQFLTFTTAPPLQTAFAVGLALPDDWFAGGRVRMVAARDRLAAALSGGGWKLLPTHGSYFLMADLAASGIGLGDRDFCEAAVVDPGIAAIPLSAFMPDGRQTPFIRLCFAKSDAILDEGAARLNRARALFEA